LYDKNYRQALIMKVTWIMKITSEHSENASGWKSKVACVKQVYLKFYFTLARWRLRGEDREEEHVRPLPIDGYRRRRRWPRSISPVFTRSFFNHRIWDLIWQKTRNTFTHSTIDSGISISEHQKKSRISENMKYIQRDVTALHISVQNCSSIFITEITI